MKLKSIQKFARALVDPTLAPTAFKVALIVGSILFIINHGIAVIEGKMTQQPYFRHNNLFGTILHQYSWSVC